MTTILRELPYFDEGSVVVVRNRKVPIKPQQIVVWVSLAEPEERELVSGTPRFPAILDTGFSHNFGIQEEHLIGWAGLQPGYFRKLGYVRVNKVAVPLHRAGIWLHRNRAGTRDESRNDQPFNLEINQGIVVYPAGAFECSAPAGAGPSRAQMDSAQALGRFRAFPRPAPHAASDLVLRLEQTIGEPTRPRDASYLRLAARFRIVSTSAQSDRHAFASSAGSMAKASTSRMPARSVSCFQCWRF